jgi:hypothetical protein
MPVDGYAGQRAPDYLIVVIRTQAESCLEQKEDYGRDTSNMTSGGKGSLQVVG